MKIQMALLAENAQKEKKWVDELRLLLSDSDEISIQSVREDYGYEEIRENRVALGQILLIDQELFERASQDEEGEESTRFEEWIQSVDRRNRAFFLVTDEKSRNLNWVTEGKVDDVILLPFRYLDLTSKVRYFDQLIQLREISHLSHSFAELANDLKDDLKLMERIHKAKQPRRFSDVKGFRISSRYLAGLASGGDYFDFIESRAGHYLSMVLSNSSSYGLSGAVLSILMSAMMKLASDTVGQAGAPAETVRRIYNEVLLTLGPKDHLSLFYGTIIREQQVFQYLNLGNMSAFYAEAKSPFKELQKQGEVISRNTKFQPLSEVKIPLSVGGRIAILSNGFVETIGGEEEIKKLLNEFRNREALDTLNELAFRVKSKVKSPEDMPARDCTGMILDTDAQLLKTF